MRKRVFIAVGLLFAVATVGKQQSSPLADRVTAVAVIVDDHTKQLNKVEGVTALLVIQNSQLQRDIDDLKKELAELREVIKRKPARP